MINLSSKLIKWVPIRGTRQFNLKNALISNIYSKDSRKYLPTGKFYNELYIKWFGSITQKFHSAF